MQTFYTLEATNLFFGLQKPRISPSVECIFICIDVIKDSRNSPLLFLPVLPSWVTIDPITFPNSKMQNIR